MTVPLPVPLPPPVTDTHESLAVAVHEHAELTLSWMDPLPPMTAMLAEDGVNANVQVCPGWRTVNVPSPLLTEMLPVRAWVLLFGTTVYTIRVCVDEDPLMLVIVIQSLLDVAVRRQPAGDAVTVKVDPLAPVADGEVETGDRVTEVQTGSPACVTVNVAFPTVMCPIRGVVVGLASTR